MSFSELEIKKGYGMSKPHYKAEGTSRPETVKSTSRTKVAVKDVEPETRAPDISTETAACSAPICQDALRTRAFLKWEAAGCPAGDGVLFWLEAERELQSSN